jgi:glycosyltransferase involved in cell wall biosynthesis
MPDKLMIAPRDSIKPILSAVICTYNRAYLLDKVLHSLCNQTLSPQNFEVVIVNDGSIDNTEEVVLSYAVMLPLRYLYQRNAGLASAKNHGLFACRGDIVLFLDDDDIATNTLLEEHVKTHRDFPAQHYAVLGYTALGEDINKDFLMHFVTEVGCFLFSYPALKHGDVLDYTYFWGGRSSCKRSLLLEYGIFNPIFRFGCEDIELGYRLSKHGLQVIYNKNAVSYMVRKVDFDGFCHRLERQGASNYVFSQIHPEPEVQQWAETTNSEKNWTMINGYYEIIIESARHLDSITNLKLASGFELDEGNRYLTYRAYWAAFKASKVKGIIDKAAILNSAGNSGSPDTK